MRHDDRESQEQRELRGPRGGNSGMSIPPGADLDDGYATDDVPADVPSEPGSDLPDPESG
jgi:hypothetical protein